MKLTRHNGRFGRHDTYSPRRNDYRFDVENGEHINVQRAKRNVYWDCYRGFTIPEFRKNPEQPDFSFEEIERMYCHGHHSDHIDVQNARSKKTRHTECSRTVEDLLKNSKICPKENTYQIGAMEESVPPSTLALVVGEFYEESERRFGSRIHTLDWALHLDEDTPHIHRRHASDYKNRCGELCPQREKVLEELGFELLDPSEPKGKHNDRRQTFNATCRTMLSDVSCKHGVHLEQEPSYGGWAYLEKQDYILMEQKRQLAVQEQKPEELTLKIEDIEALVGGVPDIACDKAVGVVTNTVRQMTHKGDLRLVEEVKNWIPSPGRKVPRKECEYAATRLDRVISKIKNAMQSALTKIQKELMQSEVKQTGKQQIQEKAKGSILAFLKKVRQDSAQRESGRKKQQEKQDIELQGI